MQKQVNCDINNINGNFLSNLHKNNSKWIKDLNFRLKTIRRKPREKSL